jgi:hypothetical protein
MDPHYLCVPPTQVSNFPSSFHASSTHLISSSSYYVWLLWCSARSFWSGTDIWAPCIPVIFILKLLFMELSPFCFSFIYSFANMCICFFCLCAILMHSTSSVSTFIFLVYIWFSQWIGGELIRVPLWCRGCEWKWLHIGRKNRSHKYKRAGKPKEQILCLILVCN